MDWESGPLFSKAKMYALRAHSEPVDSALFAFWMSLAAELLARAALARIHPVLLADPREHDNLHYAFGIIPKNPPKSIPAKALFARCSIFVPGFTDKMSVHCLIIADRRSSELHSGAAAFEGIDNSKWLPATYEVMEVLLSHLKYNFKDFLDDHAAVAVETLKDRRENITKEVLEKLAAARRAYLDRSPDEQANLLSEAEQAIVSWLKESRLRRKIDCPACNQTAVIGGETVGRTPARIDQDLGSISREIRVLPNILRCSFCKLFLNSFQEVKEAQRGNIYTVAEEEDPIEFFGINPEDYVDIDDLMSRYAEDMYGGYNNE